MVGWHHWLDGQEFEQTPGVGDGQVSLACSSPWGCKELDMTEWLNWIVKWKSLSRVQLFVTPWTCQAPLFMEFSRQECWSGLPFPSPGDLPDPGVEPTSPASPAWQADSLPLSHQELTFCKMGYHLTQVFLYMYKRKHGPQIISSSYFVHWVHGVITGSDETGIVDWSCLRLGFLFVEVF